MAAAVNAPVDCEPLTAFVPAQEPDAAQEVALSADQFNVVEAPKLTVLAMALKATVGAKADTVMVTVWVAEPPLPLQVSAYSVVFESGPVGQLPLIATAPCQPSDAVQEVALVVCQLSLAVAPLATVVDEGVKITVGAGVDTTAAAD